LTSRRRTKPGSRPLARAPARGVRIVSGSELTGSACGSRTTCAGQGR
jgi:hypothetical protein